MRINSALLYTSTATIIWGATAPIMKLTLEQVPVFSLAFIRMAIASSILAFFVTKKLKIQKEDYKSFFLSAITGVTFNLALFFIGLKLTQAIISALLTASVPILTLLAAHIYLREKLTTRLIIASLIALTGVIIIIGKPSGKLTLPQLIGNILLLLSSISWVAHEIVAKKLLKKYSAETVTFYTMSIGATIFLPLFLFEFWQNPTWINQVTISGYTGIIYGIFFASLIAYWSWQKGLSLLPAGQAAFFFYLDPISGAILAMILLGEKLTPSLIIGGILIAAAVFLAEQKRKTHLLHSK